MAFNDNRLNIAGLCPTCGRCKTCGSFMNSHSWPKPGDELSSVFWENAAGLNQTGYKGISLTEADGLAGEVR